jgi:hypothetical protein
MKQTVHGARCFALFASWYTVVFSIGNLCGDYLEHAGRRACKEIENGFKSFSFHHMSISMIFVPIGAGYMHCGKRRTSFLNLERGS